MSEPLDTTPVYRNLTLGSSLFGLTPLDLPVVLVPTGVVLVVGIFAGYSTLWGTTVGGAMLAALVALKWRRPEDYVETLLHVALCPRRLSHKERDSVLLPFPVSRMDSNP